MIQLRSRASFCISVFYSVIQKIDSPQGLVNIPFFFSPFFGSLFGIGHFRGSRLLN